jgi:hypothetical protein
MLIRALTIPSPVSNVESFFFFLAILLNFSPIFCFVLNLKAQILKICTSAQESAKKNRATIIPSNLCCRPAVGQMAPTKGMTLP